jgi:hypothetical protein
LPRKFQNFLSAPFSGPDEQDLTELTSGAESKLELFESGERTNYKQGVHTMEAAKIAEGYSSTFHSVMK